ncbi:uncharacterized protein METZ01_LOCUS327316 [marine metagenome]|uniref:Uncharacterized protein n=1 Tax=marine metagenome TaxID=408172 RepID=A0A382PR49_9ZZZZ
MVNRTNERWHEHQDFGRHDTLTIDSLRDVGEL